MKKIIIIGPSGAGKSTFARQLHIKTGLPLYHLDMIFHKTDKTTVSREEFDKVLEEILKKDSWIIDGHYGRTLEMRLKECDTVFFLDFPTEVCLEGVENRIGKPRDDIPWIESEFDHEFKQWILDFPKNQLPKTRELLCRYSDNKTIYIFKSRKEAETFLKDEF